MKYCFFLLLCVFTAFSIDFSQKIIEKGEINQVFVANNDTYIITTKTEIKVSPEMMVYLHTKYLFLFLSRFDNFYQIDKMEDTEDANEIEFTITKTGMKRKVMINNDFKEDFFKW